MAKNLRKTDYCKNCETVLKKEDNYCPKCGQENHELKIPIGHLVYETIESITHFDAKLWKTLRTVFTNPGQITSDFLNGKRASQVHPVRFYIFISFVFFILIAKIFDNTFEKIGNSKLNWENTVSLSDLLNNSDLSVLKIGKLKEVGIILPKDETKIKAFFIELSTTSQANLDSILIENGEENSIPNRAALKRTFTAIGLKKEVKVKQRLSYLFLNFDFETKTEKENFKKSLPNIKEQGIDSLLIANNISVNWFYRNLIKRLSKIDVRNIEETKNVSHSIVKIISYTMFVMMPIVAILLFLIMNRKKYFYEHLIFSVHIHTIFFLFLSIFLLFSFLTKGKFDSLFNIITLPIFGFYLLKSLKNVYNKSWLSTSFRFLLMSIPYFFIFFSFLFVSFFLGLFNS